MSIEYLLWAISFVTLFVSFFWVGIIYASRGEKKRSLDYKPFISIIIPSYNEAKTVGGTIRSLLALDYPKNKLEIIVVNDGSNDNTLEVLKKFEKLGVKIVSQENGGKANALNHGLKIAKGEIFGCIDADSFVEKDVLIKMLHNFEEEKVGAVITFIKVKDPTTFLEKLQHLEYIFASFTRVLMSKIDTLHITPGVLSLYKTKLIKKLGGFDEGGLTEDMEIAMRLKYNNYEVRIEEGAIGYTNVPTSIKSLWNQRVRWFRGFIYNSNKYKKMFMNKNYGFMGTFQVPLNIFGIATAMLIFIIFLYKAAGYVYDTILRIFSYGTDIFLSYEIPAVKVLLTSLNVKLIFPMLIAILLGFYVYHRAHRHANEKWKYPLALITYISIYPLFRTLQWVAAMYKEARGAKRVW